MHYGIVMFPTDYAIRPDDLARATEQRAFESLWVPEHTHIPASRKSPCPVAPACRRSTGTATIRSSRSRWRPRSRRSSFDRVIAFCDGWMPIAGRMGNPIDKIGELQRRAKEAGRKPIPVTAFMPKPERSVLDGLEAAGVERVVLGIPSDGPEKVLPILDGYTKLMR